MLYTGILCVFSLVSCDGQRENQTSNRIKPMYSFFVVALMKYNIENEKNFVGTWFLTAVIVILPN